MTSDLADLLATPYERGGTTVGKGLDCYHVTCELVRRRGWPPPDGLPLIYKALLNGERPSGFPAGWISVSHGEPIRDGDVLLGYGANPWAAFVHRGYIVSANPQIGVFATPVMRWKARASEIWRYVP